MKNGLTMLLVFCMGAGSLALLLYGTTQATAWPLLVMILLPGATWLTLKKLTGVK